MSYILEALKKSEKERQREEIPGFQTDHSSKPLRRMKQQPSSWMFTAAVVLLLLCVGGLFLWQLGVNKELQSAVSNVPMVSPASSLEQEKSSRGLVDTDTQGIKKDDSLVLPASKLSHPETASVINEESIVEKKESLLARDTENLPPLMDELPAAVRAAIPDLSFAGHVYSDEPSKRLIIINNRIVREGDLVVDGLSLEKIDLEGVVLRYDTSLFRVKLF